MPIIKKIHGIEIQFGGEEHTGWYPIGAAKPIPQPIRIIKMNFEIHQEDGDSYFLNYYDAENDGRYNGDSWHTTLEEALEQAKCGFGVDPEYWESC